MDRENTVWRFYGIQNLLLHFSLCSEIGEQVLTVDLEGQDNVDWEDIAVAVFNNKYEHGGGAAK